MSLVNNSNFVEVIRLENVCKEYNNRRILNKVNLSVKSGEFVAIRGKSGSGKSTLLNIMGLFEKSDSGKYFFRGKKINFQSSFQADNIRANNIGFVFQSYNLIEYLSVWDNVTMPFIYSNMKFDKDIIAYINNLMKEFGIIHLKKKKVSLLSGGEKQRVAIVRALVKKPNLIIADEPTGNLDTINAKVINDNLKKICLSGITVIVVTHSITEFKDVDSAYHLEEGMIYKDEK